jgi:hypothetical protein
MLAKLMPATKLSIAKIAIVRRRNDATAFNPVAAASDSSPSGVAAESMRLRGGTVILASSEFRLPAQ